MSDIDLSEFRTVRTKTVCVVGEFINKLEATDHEKVEAAMAEPSIDAMAISRWLQNKGLKCAHSTVARHRKGECLCGR
jgi:hypothetical protein